MTASDFLWLSRIRRAWLRHRSQPRFRQLAPWRQHRLFRSRSTQPGLPSVKRTNQMPSSLPFMRTMCLVGRVRMIIFSVELADARPPRPGPYGVEAIPSLLPQASPHSLARRRHSRACGRWYSGTAVLCRGAAAQTAGYAPSSDREIPGGVARWRWIRPEHRLPAVIGTSVSTGVARSRPQDPTARQRKFFRSAAPKFLVNNAPAI